jgi:TolB-like protein
MKRCPQCVREYDNSMMFCLDDGAELLYGPASVGEPTTAILHSTAAPGESATRPHFLTTGPGGALPPGVGETDARSTRFNKRLFVVPVIMLVIAAGALIGYRYMSAGNFEAINTIAVLPFQNAGGNGDSEYLADGLAESLIYKLSQLPNIKVSPRSSVFRYKGKEIDAEKIGVELDVDAVMSGRIFQRGDNLSISVDLVDVRNNKTLWGEQYERKMSDLLATQREIATAITAKLQMKLSGEGTKAGEKVHG